MANPFTALAALPPEMKTIAIVMYALMGLCGSMFAFLFITWWGTRGWLKPLVKAKIKGKSLLLNLTRDKKLKLESVENIAGMYRGKAGQYMINPESVYHNPAGVPVSIGYEHAGATLNPRHILFLQKILKEGIPTREIVPELDKKGKPKLDKEGRPVIKEIKEYNKKIENIEELEKVAEDFKAQTGDDMFITHQGETLRIQDIINFFKYDVNPALMEAKLENRLAKERMDVRKFPIKFLLAVGPALIMITIAAMIIMGFINSQSSVQRLAECNNKFAVAQGELITCKAQQKVITGGLDSTDVVLG